LSDPFAHSGAPHRLADACDDHEYQEDTKSAAVKESSTSLLSATTFLL
jgi:hypothetical protein